MLSIRSAKEQPMRKRTENAMRVQKDVTHLLSDLSKDPIRELSAIVSGISMGHRVQGK